MKTKAVVDDLVARRSPLVCPKDVLVACACAVVLVDDCLRLGEAHTAYDSIWLVGSH